MTPLLLGTVAVLSGLTLLSALSVHASALRQRRLSRLERLSALRARAAAERFHRDAMRCRAGKRPLGRFAAFPYGFPSPLRMVKGGRA